MTGLPVKTSEFPLSGDGLLTRWSDRTNPILVKETRQLWKSRQFVWTYFVLLVIAWGISAVAFFSPETVRQFVPFGYSLSGQVSGAAMFMIYYGFLSVALLVIVPVRTLETLVAEYDSHTIEMVMLTRIPSERITTGKLWCSILHITVYVAALAPFVAVSYLLQGIDLPTIFGLLFLVVVWSVGLCCIALLAASFGRSGAARPTATIVVLFACCLVCYFWLATVYAMLALSGGIVWGQICSGIPCCFVPWLVLSSVCLGVAVRRVRPKPPRVGRIEFISAEHLIRVARAVLVFCTTIRREMPIEQDEPPANPPKQLPFRDAQTHVISAATTADRLMNRRRQSFEVVAKRTSLVPLAVSDAFSRLRKRFYEVIKFYHWQGVCSDDASLIQHWTDRFQVPVITSEQLSDLEAAAQELIAACQSSLAPPDHHRPAESHNDIWEN